MENKSFMGKESGYAAVSNFYKGSGIIEELDGLNSEFDKIKIPAGSGFMFEITDENGEPKLVKEIEGVILYHHSINSFYKDEYTGGSNPPDCGSLDGISGKGTPGGSCKECPYNKYGSRKEGRGKACKNKKRIFILREGEILPVLLFLPTGSLVEFSGYVKRILTKGKKPCSVVTKIGLNRTVSGRGIQFSKAVFSHVRDLTPEEAEAVLPIAEYAMSCSMDIAIDTDLNTVRGIEITEDVEVIND